MSPRPWYTGIAMTGAVLCVMPRVTGANAAQAPWPLVNARPGPGGVIVTMSFFAKWLDGRIDNPKAGWKGKGLWATY